MRKIHEANEVTGHAGGVVLLPQPDNEEWRALLRQRMHEAIDALRLATALLEDLPADIEPLGTLNTRTETNELLNKVGTNYGMLYQEFRAWERRREDRRGR